MMKVGVFGLALGLGLVASGCGVFDVYRDRQMPAPGSPQAQTRQLVPQVTSEEPPLPPVMLPGVEHLPPYWFWADKQRQQFDRHLQQQWVYYYQNRQPPPQFSRPPICQSTLLGGLVITSCY